MTLGALPVSDEASGMCLIVGLECLDLQAVGLQKLIACLVLFSLAVGGKGEK